METANGNTLNCAESVIVRVDRNYPLSALNDSVMRIASMCGGGICGSGQICGAANGATICLGLALGTDGTEESDLFKERRAFARNIGNQFLQEFVEAWGTTDCRHLKAMDSGAMNPAGTLRIQQEPVRDRCDEYVQWSAEKIVEILSKIKEE
ncbi:MAG: hypothetical protein BAJATHORv1_90068 [Candidatus Thorarchaeota archaeon]|nr:MAG: hypothetical protein BAJATHORv1_90068 [Candidatus Thorarchaeota archaeon]